MVTSLLHHAVEGPVADDRMSSFPPALLLLAGDVSCGAVVAGRGAMGAGQGRGPQQAVCRGAAVLRRRWPPSPCRGAAVDCVLLLGGVAGAMRGYDACRSVGGGLQSEAALIDVRLDVGRYLLGGRFFSSFWDRVWAE